VEFDKKYAKERSGIHLIAQMANVSIGTVDRAFARSPGHQGSTRNESWKSRSKSDTSRTSRLARSRLPNRRLE